jgi:hypothetical protein
MNQRCEVCASFRPELPSAGQKLVEMVFEARPVLLCKGHARIAENSGVTTFEALRGLYGSGRRSYVPRRDPHSVAPPGEKRRGPGRRASDQPAVGLD